MDILCYYVDRAYWFYFTMLHIVSICMMASLFSSSWKIGKALMLCAWYVVLTLLRCCITLSTVFLVVLSFAKISLNSYRPCRLICSSTHTTTTNSKYIFVPSNIALRALAFSNWLIFVIRCVPYLVGMRFLFGGGWECVWWGMGMYLVVNGMHVFSKKKTF